MKTTYLSMALLCLFLSPLTSTGNSSLETMQTFTAFGENLHTAAIQIKVASLGGHQGNCISIQVTNKSPKTLYTYLEPGRRFLSDDTTIQDILIVKRKNIIVASGATVTVNGYGFCCQSKLHSPYPDALFSQSKMATAALKELCDSINTGTFENQLIQSAIWSISDNHELTSLHSNNITDQMKLMRTVASIRNEPIPWYTFTYQQDTSSLFTDKKVNIFGNIEYYLRNNSAVTIVVRNAKGQVIKTLVEGHIYGQGKEHYEVDFSVANWPKGRYEIFVIEDFVNLNKKVSFKI